MCITEQGGVVVVVIAGENVVAVDQFVLRVGAFVERIIRIHENMPLMPGDGFHDEVVIEIRAFGIGCSRGEGVVGDYSGRCWEVESLKVGKSGVGSRESEVGSRKSEVGRRKKEEGRRKKEEAERDAP